jgi:serine/threonine protein phosphatase PrpC
VIELRWGEATDVGRVRTNNEDGLITSDRLFAVADGMGGHQGGEVASDMALRTLEDAFVEPTTEGLLEAARTANDAVYERAAGDSELRGMGTTLVAIAPVEDSDSLAWVNVGDSRLYLLRDGDLTQISEDHSLVQEAVRAGELSPEEAQTHPQRNIVTRALGIDANVVIDGDEVNAFAGDRYLLCSDGLYDFVDDALIASTLRRLDDPTEAARELVRVANEGGGRDNITVVVVDVVDDDRQGAAAASDVEGGTAEGHALATKDRTAAAAAAAQPEPKREKPPKPRLLTWRLVVFLVLFVVILLGAFGAVGYYARNTYYVGFKGDSVVIFKGKPGGVLWFKPTVDEPTALTRSQVPPAQIDRVTKGQEESSLQAARDYVRDALTTTTTTSTTTTTTTTTLPPPIPG